MDSPASNTKLLLPNQSSLQENLGPDDDVFLFDKSWTDDTWTKFNRAPIVDLKTNQIKHLNQQRENLSLRGQPEDFSSNPQSFLITQEEEEEEPAKSPVELENHSKTFTNDQPNQEPEDHQSVRSKVKKPLPPRVSNEDTELNNLKDMKVKDEKKDTKVIVKAKQPERYESVLENIHSNVRAAQLDENIRSASVSPKILRSKCGGISDTGACGISDTGDDATTSSNLNCRDVMYASVQSLNRWRKNSDSSAEPSTPLLGFSQTLWKKVETKAVGFFSSISKRN